MTQPAGIALGAAMAVCASLCSADQLSWTQLPPLPDPVGFAGMFAGTSRGALIVAGGANFTGKMPWEGGTKVWHSRAFVLESPSAKWRPFELPFPCAYGISVTTDDGVVCIGGSNSERHLTSVFILTWRDRQLQVRDLPPLPFPLANGCGAIWRNAIYIGGGTDSPSATNALRKFLRLDLKRSNDGWTELEPWPGPPRMLAIAAAVGDSVYIVGGTDLAPDAQGNPRRTYLRDGYRFSPRSGGWRRIPDMPNPVVGAASPAPAPTRSSFLVVAGDDGSLVNFEPKSRHPGFPPRILSYDTRRDQWTVLKDEAKAPRATLPCTRWNGDWILPSGESRPGVRSPEVWALRAR